MSGRKAFMLRVEIEIHSIDSHGIRLSQSGNVALSVHTLSSSAITMRAYPAFPIHIHEKLIFEKVISCVSTLSDVQDRLNAESLKMELIQWRSLRTTKPTILAYLRTKLSKVLFPGSTNKEMMSGGRIKFQMEPAQKFWGSTGPKVEVSTKITLEERMAEVGIPAKVSDHRGLRGAKSKLTDCVCQSSGLCRRQARTSSGRLISYGVPGSREGISCNDCCICNSYCRYFNFEPFGSQSCSFRFSREKTDKPMSYRQLFYDNLDYFYKQLQRRENNPIGC